MGRLVTVPRAEKHAVWSTSQDRRYDPAYRTVEAASTASEHGVPTRQLEGASVWQAREEPARSLRERPGYECWRGKLDASGTVLRWRCTGLERAAYLHAG